MGSGSRMNRSRSPIRMWPHSKGLFCCLTRGTIAYGVGWSGGWGDRGRVFAVLVDGVLWHGEDTATSRGVLATGLRRVLALGIDVSTSGWTHLLVVSHPVVLPNLVCFQAERGWRVREMLLQPEKIGIDRK